MKTRLTKAERLKRLKDKPADAKRWIVLHVYPTWKESDRVYDADVIAVCKVKKQLMKLDEWLQASDGLRPDAVFK